MKGDFSRVTFDPKKHYNAVYLEQGRVITDADVNEEHSIQQYRAEMTIADVLGKTGTPKNDPGFTLTVKNDDLEIGAGRYYLDGLLIENDQTVEYAVQPYFRNPALPGEKAKGVLASAGARLGMVYLDGVARTVTSLEEPGMRETALGGPDTSVREQIVWQVKVLPLQFTFDPLVAAELSKVLSAEQNLKTQLDATFDPTQRKKLLSELKQLHAARGLALATAKLGCGTNFEEWQALVNPRNNTLIVQTPPAAEEDEICSVPSGSGYQSGENQLYRVEVHKTAANGRRSGSFFKWSRENGSIAAAIEKLNSLDPDQATTSKVRVASTGRDAFLGFNSGGWVEYVDEDVALSGPLSRLRQITVDGHEVTLDQPIQVNHARHPKFLRWDQPGDLSAALVTEDGVAMNAADGAFIKLERNIEVSFGPGVFRTGEYWLIPARATAGRLEFPAGPQLPAGPAHHFARLGLVFLDDAQRLRLLLDCRKKIPPLTAIAAEDVSYDNTGCPDLAQAKTVQEAIDLLCHTQTCCFKVSPGPGWESVFDRIDPKQDAHICFEFGDYLLTGAKQIPGKGNLMLSGCGPGSRIVAPSAEAALQFLNCKKVSVRDLSVETGVAGVDRKGPHKHLNGALNFTDCDAVEIDRIALKCGASLNRAAACLTVLNAADKLRPVRIERSEFNVGHMQTGVLLINVSRAHLEGNLIRVYDKPSELSLKQALNFPKKPENRLTLANIRQMFISGATLGDQSPLHRNIKITMNGHAIHFKSLVSSSRDWTTLIAGNEPLAINSPLELLKLARRRVDLILLGDRNFQIPRSFLDLIKSLELQDQAVAFQGIVIGGEAAHDLRILNNTIENALQGVHIGLSRKGGVSNDPLMVGIGAAASTRVSLGGATITGNRIFIRLPVYAGKLERHGVLIGNCESLLVENNDLSLERLPRADQIVIDGVRIWGKLGNRAIVNQNHIHALNGDSKQSFDFGVFIHPVTSKPQSALWRAVNNVAPSRQSTVRLDNGADQASNVP